MTSRTPETCLPAGAGCGTSETETCNQFLMREWTPDMLTEWLKTQVGLSQTDLKKLQIDIDGMPLTGAQLQNMMPTTPHGPVVIERYTAITSLRETFALSRTAARKIVDTYIQHIDIPCEMAVAGILLAREDQRSSTLFVEGYLRAIMHTLNQLDKYAPSYWVFPAPEVNTADLVHGLEGITKSAVRKLVHAVLARCPCVSVASNVERDAFETVLLPHKDTSGARLEMDIMAQNHAAHICSECLLDELHARENTLGCRYWVGCVTCPLFKGSSVFRKAEFYHLPSAEAGYKAGLRVTYRPSPCSGLPIITYPLLAEEAPTFPFRAIELHEGKSDELPGVVLNHVTLRLASGGHMTCYVQHTLVGWYRLVFNFSEGRRNQLAIMEVRVNFSPECWILEFTRHGVDDASSSSGESDAGSDATYDDTNVFASVSNVHDFNLSGWSWNGNSALLTIMQNLVDLFRADAGSRFEPSPEGLTVVNSDGEVVWHFNVELQNTGVCYGCDCPCSAEYRDAVLINFANGQQVTGVQTVAVSKDVYSPLRDEEHRAFFQLRSDQAEDLRWSPVRRAFIGTLARLQASLPA